MKILLEGLKKFSSEVYPSQRPLFEKLAKGQTPHTLFIACSDSRIDPNLMTQTEPGDVFVIRNAGNIIPPFGATSGGEEASIEFAVDGLKVKHIVVCGHSDCGAIGTLMNPNRSRELPSVERWISHAEATRRRVLEYSPSASIEDAIRENVLVQIDNLKTHPSVSAAIRRKSVNLFGWVYYFETGYVSIYDPKRERFIPSLEIHLNCEADLLQYAL